MDIISFIPKFLESEVSNLEDPAAVYEAVAGLQAAMELEHGLVEVAHAWGGGVFMYYAISWGMTHEGSA